MSRQEIKRLPLIIFITFMPIWLVPGLSLLLFPSVSPFESFALGAVITIVIANIFWATRIAGKVIRRLLILVVLLGLLAIVLLLLSKLLL